MNNLMNQTNNNDYKNDIAQIVNATGNMVTAMNTMISQMGNMDTRMTKMEEHVAGLDGKYDFLVNKSEIDTQQKKRLAEARRIRISTILGVNKDKAKRTTQERVTYRKYSGIFFGRLASDVKKYTNCGNTFEETPKEEFENVMTFITEWVPTCGVAELKRIADEEAIAKKIADESGY